MPYSIRKVRNQECYAVKNTVSGTTLEKAKRQVRLLHSIQKKKK